MTSRMLNDSGMTGSAAQSDNLEEVWSIVRDMKDKLDKLRANVEEGINDRCKDLNFSVIEKDNELSRLLSETDAKLRDLRNEFRKEVKELKTKHKTESSEMSQEIDNLKVEKLELMRKINTLELQRQNSILNEQRVGILTSQLE